MISVDAAFHWPRCLLPCSESVAAGEFLTSCARVEVLAYCWAAPTLLQDWSAASRVLQPAA